MIKYLNAIATVLLLLLITVVRLLGNKRLDWQKISEGIESFRNVLEFVSNLPKWLQYYSDLDANVRRLHDKRERLQVRSEDLRLRIEDEEYKTGRTRKKEVNSWLSSVESKDTEVQSILQEIDRGTTRVAAFVHRAWWGNIVEKKIQEVDDLYALGVFEHVLSPVRKTAELVAKPLVGKASEDIRLILTWLVNGVTKIGVHGVTAIGKTALLMHVHNQLLQSGNVHVYMVQTPKDCVQYHLQSCIAIAVGLNLQEEDGLKRAAILCRALRRRSFVLILDGLTKYFAVEKVGIPLDSARGKLLISSRSPDVCRKMGCQNNTIAVKPLLYDEAFHLFKQTFESNTYLEPPKEVLARQIVELCGGVPPKIVQKAKDLIGVDDISVWRRVLNDMSVSRSGC